MAKKRGLNVKVDSTGTSTANVGREPDERAVSHACVKSVPNNRIARQVKTIDFIEFTHILAFGNNLIRELESIKPIDATADVRLGGSSLDGEPLPDPFYESAGGFENLFQHATKLADAFLDSVSC
ncbi:Low molecular weight phosphotyrosine protein phosphatase [Leucoagaricus sp. SymC.cos]|nr:Low molecular weight phosphotyrosine protein phosphatase [Leucoagaricus sp. SymC.cos]